MGNIEATLKERKAVYGDFSSGLSIKADVIRAIRQQHFDKAGEALSEEHLLCFVHIVDKLLRAASSPSHIDTWHDIAGYATLIEDYMREQNNAQK